MTSIRMLTQKTFKTEWENEIIMITFLSGLVWIYDCQYVVQVIPDWST